MNTEIRVAIDKFKEVKDILKKFDSKDEAIEYLVNETKLSKEECSTAYDIIIKIENKFQFNGEKLFWANVMGWFNYYGLTVMAVIMIPNIIYAVKHKNGESTYHNKAVEI